MFKEMRRHDRALGDAEIDNILIDGLYGILSTSGIDGYAYGVPLSYVWHNKNIYLHAATEGQKLEAIRQNQKVSFCVVGKVQTLPDKFSTQYESVILFGKASMIDGVEKDRALMALVEKYSPDYRQQGEAYIENAKEKTAVIKLEVEHCTGKSRR